MEISQSGRSKKVDEVMNDILKNIELNMISFSKGQKKIAQFIMSHYNKAVLMTAAKIAEETGVSESTVVRFAKGFRNFNRHFRNL